MWICIRSRFPWVAIEGKGVHCRTNAFSSIVVPASHFPSLQRVAPTRTAELYHGTVLSTLVPKVRGEVLASFARNVMMDLSMEDRLTDALPGQCVDGRRRAPQQAEYDWLCNGRRVECKSSQIHFRVHSSTWYFRFPAVKLALEGQRAQDAFDDLILVLYTPYRIHIYRHDLFFGVTTAGKSTPSRGHTVQIGSAKTFCWKEGLESILDKLDAEGNACERIADLPLDDRRMKMACLRHSRPKMVNIYENVPLASLSPPARGLTLQRLAREIDAAVSPGASFSTSRSSVDCMGRTRSEYTALYDWMRDGVRVECKSAQLSWCKGTSCWKVMFIAIKIAKRTMHNSVFDELHLMVYTPRGVYAYHHDLQLGVSSTGKDTQAEGCCIVICGPRNETSWSRSLDSILEKLDRGGCRRVAFVRWD